jgi:hypothetical protein
MTLSVMTLHAYDFKQQGNQRPLVQQQGKPCCWTRGLSISSLMYVTISVMTIHAHDFIALLLDK